MEITTGETKISDIIIIVPINGYVTIIGLLILLAKIFTKHFQRSSTTIIHQHLFTDFF